HAGLLSPRDDGATSLPPERVSLQHTTLFRSQPPVRDSGHGSNETKSADNASIYGYTAALAALAASALAWQILHDPMPGPTPWPLAIPALLAALAERRAVRLSQRLEIYISLLPRLFAAVVFGPVGAMVVGATSMLGEFRRPYLQWAVYTSA